MREATRGGTHATAAAIGAGHPVGMPCRVHAGHTGARRGAARTVGPVIETLAVENYRSLRRLIVPLAALNVVTGANGSGKSSLYRALRLLADSSRNAAVAALAREGGLPSTWWAGPEKTGRAVREGRHPVQGTIRGGAVGLRLGFGADDFSYAIDFGLPAPSLTAFALDPEIKRQSIWHGPVLRPVALLCDRHNGMVRLRGDDGTWRPPRLIRGYDSMLSEFADPQRRPARRRSGSSKRRQERCMLGRPPKQRSRCSASTHTYTGRPAAGDENAHDCSWNSAVPTPLKPLGRAPRLPFRRR
jgi:energy-coupling factor transporter ATP-binding protein EcfA2